MPLYVRTVVEPPQSMSRALMISETLPLCVVVSHLLVSMLSMGAGEGFSLSAKATSSSSSLFFAAG